MSIVARLALTSGRAARPALVFLLALALGDAFGETRIAVVDFELKDLTLQPDSPAEIGRTASIRPQVEQALRALGCYQNVAISTAEVARANPAVGYLYDHPDLAADLGRSAGADWILIGRLHKPSFLFAYLMGRLVETRTGRVAVDLVVEAKGQSEPVTERGAIRLAEQIDRAIRAAGAGQPKAP